MNLMGKVFPLFFTIFVSIVI